MTRTFVLLVALCVAAGCLYGHGAQAQKEKSLSADLTFLFDCKGDAYPPSDGDIEILLMNEQFRVLNKVRLAKEQRIDYPFTMNIVAIDNQRRRIEFDGVPVWAGTYSVRLYTPPPTRHSSDLENDLLVFVSKKLGCGVRQVERHDNGEDAREFFDELFKIAEGWFRQAEDMQRPPI